MDNKFEYEFETQVNDRLDVLNNGKNNNKFDNFNNSLKGVNNYSNNVNNQSSSDKTNSNNNSYDGSSNNNINDGLSNNLDLNNNSNSGDNGYENISNKGPRLDDFNKNKVVNNNNNNNNFSNDLNISKNNKNDLPKSNKNDNLRNNNYINTNNFKTSPQNNLKKAAIKKAASTFHPAAGAIANSKLGDKAIESILNNNKLKNLPLMPKNNNTSNPNDSNGNKNTNIKSNSGGNKEGFFESLTGLSPKNTKILGLTSLVFVFFLFIIFGFVIPAVAIQKIGAIGSADSVKNEDELEKKLSTDDYKLGEDDFDLDLDTGAYLDIYIDKDHEEFVDVKLVAKYNEYTIDNVSDFFGSNSYCDENNNCTDSVENKFFLKLYDIYFLYLTKYNVKLDIPLIMSTLIYKSDDINEVFALNLSDYDRKYIVESDWNPSNVTSLDWDYDYENQYNYLVFNDFSLDMQVLAKNMVSKTTEQSCVKDNMVVKKENIKDSESNLECGSGEELVVGNVSYKLDLDKYRDFLPEYIEKKYYLNRIILNPVRSVGPNYYSDKVPSVKNRKISSSSSASSNVTSDGTQVYSSNNLANEMVNIANREYERNKNGETTPYTYQSANGSGAGVSWCGYFVNYVSKQASYNGRSVFDLVGSGTGAGSYMYRFNTGDGLKFYYNDSCSYLSGKNGNISYTPKPGDYIFFDWESEFRDISTVIQCLNDSGPCYQDHIGLVEKYVDGNVYTIEGNSSDPLTGRSWGSNDTSVVGKHKYDLTNCNIIGFGSWY